MVVPGVVVVGVAVVVAVVEVLTPPPRSMAVRRPPALTMLCMGACTATVPVGCHEVCTRTRTVAAAAAAAVAVVAASYRTAAAVARRGARPHSTDSECTLGPAARQRLRRHRTTCHRWRASCCLGSAGKTPLLFWTTVCVLPRVLGARFAAC